MEKVKTEVIRILIFMDAESFLVLVGYWGWLIQSKRKVTSNLLLKYVLRQLSFEDVEGSDDGGSSWCTKLHDHHLE